MRRAHRHDWLRAAERARGWLARVGGASSEPPASYELGLLLCERIARGAGGPRSCTAVAMPMPTPLALLGLARGDLLALTAQMAVSRRAALPEEAGQQRCWAELLGALATSYARSGDVAVVAALVRGAAHLDLADPWLDEAHAYLLDQQAPAGHFGLLARELAHLPPNSGSPEEAYLRLTIEVLWAICALVAPPPRGSDGDGEGMDMRQTAV